MSWLITVILWYLYPLNDYSKTSSRPQQRFLFWNIISDKSLWSLFLLTNSYINGLSSVITFRPKNHAARALLYQHLLFFILLERNIIVLWCWHPRVKVNCLLPCFVLWSWLYRHGKITKVSVRFLFIWATHIRFVKKFRNSIQHQFYDAGYHIRNCEQSLNSFFLLDTTRTKIVFGI